MRAEVFLGENVVEPADADADAQLHQLGDEGGHLVRAEAPQPVPRLDDDGPRLEAPILGGGDELTEAPFLAALVVRRTGRPSPRQLGEGGGTRRDMTAAPVR